VLSLLCADLRLHLPLHRPLADFRYTYRVKKHSSMLSIWRRQKLLLISLRMDRRLSMIPKVVDQGS
jgi:hypothetical protein